MTVAIIGAGVMGEALLSGLIRGGHELADLMVGEKRPERATELREKYESCKTNRRGTPEQPLEQDRPLSPPITQVAP